MNNDKKYGIYYSNDDNYDMCSCIGGFSLPDAIECISYFSYLLRLKKIIFMNQMIIKIIHIYQLMVK